MVYQLKFLIFFWIGNVILRATFIIWGCVKIEICYKSS